MCRILVKPSQRAKPVSGKQVLQPRDSKDMEQVTPLSTSADRLVGFDGICQQVRSSLDGARIHCVSLHDATGNLLWLTTNSMGPDEHNAVQDAFESFRSSHSRPIMAYDLGDSRSAVLFRSLNSRRHFAGAIMVILETRGIPQSASALVNLMTPKLERVLNDFAAIAKPLPPAAPASAPVLAPAPAVSVARAPTDVAPQIDHLNAALRRRPIALHVQRLVPLTKGSQLRRYEVLLRASPDDTANAAPQTMLRTAVHHGLGSMIDRRVLTQLIGWLVHHPDVWRKRPALFSVNLTRTALIDEHFLRFVGLCLQKSSLPKAMIGFEIDVPTAVDLGNKTAELAAALDQLGCPLLLDDFGLRTECFDLLRLPAVRYVKLAPQLTAKMRTDKLSQAGITAVVQMARVLGMHTVAKRTETAAEHEWLTALGVDFVQSNAVSPAVAIDSLL